MMSPTGISRSVFLAVDFEPKQFVESRLRASGADEDRKLETIVQDLKATVQDSTDQLLAFIDRDHQTFLELSGDFVHVDATVGTLRGPLVHLKEKVETVKRAAAGPTEAMKEFDVRLVEVRARKRQLQKKMLARSLRLSIERDLVNNEENRAVQKLALLCRVLPKSECVDLKRELEHRLCDNPLDLPKEAMKERLRSLVMLGAADAAIRTLTADLSAHDQGHVLDRVLSNHQRLLEVCAEEGLGAVFEFPSKSIVTAFTLSTSKAISSADARKAESMRKILSRLSPTGMPHVPLRWNPRMHSELRFQDAVVELEKNTDLSGLKRALEVLYAEERSMADVNKDVVLAVHLCRMACRLVSRYINYLEVTEFEPTLVVHRVKDAFALEKDLLKRTLVHFPAQWNGNDLCIKSLADRANHAGLGLLQILQRSVIEMCGREVASLDKLIRTTYRMTDKPLSDGSTPSAANILQPLHSMLDQLTGPESDAALVEWTQQILDEIKGQFMHVADSMVKREAALVNHQKTGKGGMSDSYKIAKQMAMDAEFVVNEATSLMERRLGVPQFDQSSLLELVKVCQDFADTAGTGT